MQLFILRMYIFRITVFLRELLVKRNLECWFYHYRYCCLFYSYEISLYNRYHLATAKYYRNFKSEFNTKGLRLGWCFSDIVVSSLDSTRRPHTLRWFSWNQRITYGVVSEGFFLRKCFFVWKFCGVFAEIATKKTFYCIRKECGNSEKSLQKFLGKFLTNFCNDAFPNDPISELLMKLGLLWIPHVFFPGKAQRIQKIRASSTTTRDRNLQFRGAVSTGGSPLDFCFFSSIYVQFSKTSPLKSGESSETSSGENRVEFCHVCGCHGFFGPEKSSPFTQTRSRSGHGMHFFIFRGRRLGRWIRRRWICFFGSPQIFSPENPKLIDLFFWAFLEGPSATMPGCPKTAH